MSIAWRRERNFVALRVIEVDVFGIFKIPRRIEGTLVGWGHRKQSEEGG
jgi:hypothetical protein